MKKLLALIALAAVSQAASASLLVYEPFNYNNAGDPIAGQVNTYSAGSPLTWLGAGTGTSPVHQIATGSLTSVFPGVSSIGNSAALENKDITQIEKLNVSGSGGANSTLYYSMLLNVPSVSGLTVANTNNVANNDILAAFNNTTTATLTKPSSWAGELVIRKGSASNTFDLGVHASTGGNAAWSGDLLPSTTYLIVVGYTQGANPGTSTNGTNSIWINPDPASFGTNNIPTAVGSMNGTISNTPGVDSVGSFLLGGGIAAGAAPSTTYVDEIRIGTTWADVTGAVAAVPEPASVALIGVSGLGLLMRRRRTA